MDQSLFLSAEVRWFNKGAIPQPIDEWFASRGANWESYPPRTDYYLIFTEPTACGVKLRESRFEIKTLTTVGQPIVLDGQPIANIEHWQKWSSANLFTNVHQQELLENETLWRPVAKHRVLLHYPTDEALTGGCQVELTKLGFSEAQYWTLGFEAFGETRDLVSLLLSTFDKTVEDGLFERLGPLISAENALSYPAWLSRSQAKA